MVEGLRFTRKRFLGVGAAAWASLAGLDVRGALAAALPAGVESVGYVSRPDLKPPLITFGTPANDTAPGYIFLAPFNISAGSGTYTTTPNSQSHSGPLVVDNTGEPVWFLPFGSTTAIGLRVQKYQGRRVLTWYEGTVLGAEGGSFFIYDPTYHQVSHVQAGRGRHGDLHDFLITPEGTALITIYGQINADLTSIGGPASGPLVTGIVQEIDIPTGKVLLEWRSQEHVPITETYVPQASPPANNYDYFHLNSIDVDTDGNLIISGRNTSTIYKIDRRTGEIIWRLGGKSSDFDVAPDASFAFQHDARRRPDGTLTIFDNNAAFPTDKTFSRGMRVKLDMKKMKATLVKEYLAPTPRTVFAMGNVQQLDDGGVMIGWGAAGSFTELGPDGSVRLDASFADGQVTYRAFRFELDAAPKGIPATEVVANGDGSLTLYVSWNGATKVAKWQLLVGETAATLKPAGTVRRSGFETAIRLPVTSGTVSVVALDAEGTKLRTAAPTVLQA
ncbi:MAG TPA: arylsulfotransferase family protein [Gaiellaceae bacterium]|nr:arylsulfotransferase family protein [Gaiellaceae bacterium]